MDPLDDTFPDVVRNVASTIRFAQQQATKEAARYLDRRADDIERHGAGYLKPRIEQAEQLRALADSVRAGASGSRVTAQDKE